MVTAVLDALSAPQGAGDLRTHPQRYHDALAEAMKRLLASNLLPRRAGQSVKALVHIYFAELRELDHDSALQDKWIEEYRARWAAQRAAASVSPGDGGAWLGGDAARAIICDAITVPVVTGDIDLSAVEDLIAACVRYHRVRALRDQTCQFPGGCDQPAASCEPHHVIHRADGGRTSLTGLKNYCWWHHHVVLHQLGWTLTIHPDGTSQVRSPDGKVIRSHSPPPRPG